MDEDSITIGLASLNSDEESARGHKSRKKYMNQDLYCSETKPESDSSASLETKSAYLGKFEQLKLNSSILVTNYQICVQNLTYVINAPATRSMENIPRFLSNWFGIPSPASKPKCVLAEVNLKADSGEILAIVGPSGSGKSSLLDAIFGNVNEKLLTGQVFVNGSPRNAKHFKRVAGYVTQDDALFPMLSVRETLLYSARLRLVGSRAHKLQEVESLLVELGLQAVADTRVGTVEHRGVSGGERRRVSMGVDLVHGPSVLLLDEPTSGLDSAAALSVLQVVSNMTHASPPTLNVDSPTVASGIFKPRTVILTCHQPSWRMLCLFDRVAILNKGRVAHYGSLSDLEASFTSMGRQIPAHSNVVEFAIDCLDTNRQPTGSSSSLGLGGQVEAFSVESRGDGGPVQAQDGDSVPGHAGYANTCLLEIAILTERYCANILRTKELFWVRGLQVFLCGLCLGTLFLGVTNSQQGQVKRLGFLAFSLAFLLTSSMEVLPIFLQERRVLMRESGCRAYRTSSYLAASSLVFLPFLLWLALLFSVPAYWLVGLYPSIASFCFFVLVVWVVLVTANSIVAFFAALCPNYITGNAMIASVMGACFLFSGYFIPQQLIPNYWIWAHFLSVFKYPFDALLINEYSNLANVCFVESPSPPFSCTQTGAQYLSVNLLEGTSKWVSVLVLACFAAAYKLLSYVVLSNLCSSSSAI